MEWNKEIVKRWSCPECSGKTKEPASDVCLMCWPPPMLHWVEDFRLNEKKINTLHQRKSGIAALLHDEPAGVHEEQELLTDKRRRQRK